MKCTKIYSLLQQFLFYIHLQLLVYKKIDAFFLIILPILLSILRSVVWCCSMLIISIVGRQFGPLWSMVHSIVSTDTATDSSVELSRGSFRTLLQILYNWLLAWGWCGVHSVNSIGVVFSQDGVELECVPRYYVYNVILGLQLGLGDYLTISTASITCHSPPRPQNSHFHLFPSQWAG